MPMTFGCFELKTTNLERLLSMTFAGFGSKRVNFFGSPISLSRFTDSPPGQLFDSPIPPLVTFSIPL